MLFDREDTIVAICTPPGCGMTGILRLSGADAFSILDTSFHPHPSSPAPAGSAPPSRRHVLRGTMHLTLHPTPDTECLSSCPVLVYRMPAPRSFTREDVAEIHMPGSPPLLQAGLRTLVASGARVAQPGEFTLRAFLRGRLDLGQVESLGRLIAAETEAERREALSRLDRRLGNRIADLRRSLLEALAELEARIDFEEEESGTLPAGLTAILETAESGCRTLAAGVDLEGRCMARVRLLGLTNAGKSALLNALLGTDAAIVSGQPTTTRDILRHPLRVGHAEIRIEDSPGLDDGTSGMAALASAHATGSLASVSHAILVVDGGTAPDPRLQSLLHALPPSRVLLVRSKADQWAPSREMAMPPQEVGALHKEAGQAAADSGMEPILRWIRDAGHTHVTTLSSSVVTGEGLAELRTALEAEALGDAAGVLAGHCSVREAAELREAAEALRAARGGMGDARGEELVAEDIRHAVEALHRAEGGGYADAVLDSIFSRFCIGK